jgi:TonB family protein
MKWQFGSLTFAMIVGVLSGSLAMNRAVTGTPAQTPQAQPASAPQALATKPAPPPDAALDGAQSLIGRALLLRGFYAGGEFAYDSLGHVKGEPRVTDWTLAGAQIDKVTRHSGGQVGSQGPGELEFDGLRVAMRYNPDQHVFERHALKNQKLKIILAVNDGARGLQGALATMFSVGIDPALQRSMPPCWKHYFAPSTAWPPDDLTGQTIISANATAGVELPILEKKLEPEFTAEARDDHVKGTVMIKMVVSADGVPRRISIKQPLGYGLDARTAETVAKYRFRPGMKDGKPVAVEMSVNQGFDLYPPPSH